MKKILVILVTLCSVFCIITSQISMSSAQATSATTISASGTIEMPIVESKVNTLLAGYGIYPSPAAESVIQQLAKFDVLDVDLETGPDLYRIRALNPDAIIFGYKDILGIRPTTLDYSEVTQHEDWFLHDLDGNRIMHSVFGAYLMDIGSSGWRQHYTNWVNEYLSLYSFDGIFADDVWNSFNFDVWTVPSSEIPAEIGEHWHSDMLGMIEFVKASIGDKLLVVNTGNNGDYVYACDGKMEEEFVHPSWYPIDAFHDYYINWENKVNNLRDLSQAGKYYLVLPGTIISKNPTAAELEEVHDMLVYCFSSYLLGASGEKASFGFNGFYSNDGSGGYYEEFDVSLGSPLNAYYLMDTVYSRDFSNGKVLVNPTTSSHTVNLGGEYKTLDGQTVSSVTLDDHSGIILLNN
jgi:hypothetical protein